MKKLIIKITILSFTTLSILFSALYLNQNFEINYCAAIQNKLNKLERIKTNKIIIIGGSNVAFGLNSDIIEKEIGIPVVNMGLHGGIPTKYQIELIKKYIHKGDIILLSREYSGFSKKGWLKFDGTESAHIPIYLPSKTNILLSNYTMFKSAISGFLAIIKKNYFNYDGTQQSNNFGVYDLRAFIDDNLNKDYLSGAFNDSAVVSFVKPCNIAINDLIEYKKHFDEIGVKFYYYSPSLIDENNFEDSVKNYMALLKSETGIKFLCNNKYNLFPRKYFLDTPYHLNNIGQNINTQNIIDILINNNIFEKKFTKYIIGQYPYKEIDLKSFKDLNGCVIDKEKDSELVVKYINSKSNYVRTAIKDSDYTNFQFHLTLNLPSSLKNKILFSGVGISKFNSVIDLKNNNYLFVKEKMENIKYKNFSLFGFVIDSINIDQKIIFKKAQLLDNNMKMNVNEKLDSIYICKPSQSEYLLRIKKEHDTIGIKEVFDLKGIDDFIFKNDKLYKFIYTKNQLIIKGFYTNKELFKLLLHNKNELKFIATKESFIYIYRSIK